MKNMLTNAIKRRVSQPPNFARNSLLIIACLLTLSANASPEITGGATMAYLLSDDDNINNELTFSSDLVFTWSLYQDSFYLYLEAYNSPKNNAISSVLPEANADAGSAIDKDLKGRIQISELGYRHFIDQSQFLTFGLIDISNYFDQSRIASDENTQFLGVTFVQNPTIEFPDYTLGMVYENAIQTDLVFRTAVTSSHGISDNPNLSYSQLININSDNKGLFLISSLSQHFGDWLFKGGVWLNTADHQTLNNSAADKNNYGGYLLTGYQVNEHGINIRLGTSKESISFAQHFIGVSYQYKQAFWAFGLGAAKIFLSDSISNSTNKDTQQLETYVRYKINSNFLITTDIQYLSNSNFNFSDVIYEKDQTLLGLRLTYLVK